MAEEDKVPSTKRKFGLKDFNTIAEYIVDEHARRRDAKDRANKVKVWNEVDRQLRMEPDLSFKKNSKGEFEPSKKWMPEFELPLQSQTSEVLTADARRMMFPDSGPWFSAHAAMTDKYLDRADFAALISGDESEVPSKLNQENADKLLEGWLNHFHRQYDFKGHWDRINAEAFHYGIGVGRARNVKKSVYQNTSKGVVKGEQTIPVLFPRSIKKTFLDDRPFNLMNEGQLIGPSVIFEETKSIADLRLAASKGKADPKDMDGGWMAKSLSGMEADASGNLTVLEYEGDLIVPRRSTRSLFIPGVIVTVAKGDRAKVIRFRFREMATPSYIVVPYHLENMDSPYAESPLMKGMPIQKAASLAFNMLNASAILSGRPPLSYDRSDPMFTAQGGPEIYPGALWGTLGKIVVHQIGSTAELTNLYFQLVSQYHDLTGVNAPRLGAQTVSHTTAFAKEAEISRGTIRTVDYVRSALDGPMSRWLSMEFELGRASMGKRTDTVYLDSYKGFVDLKKDHIPDEAAFEVFGSGGPAENSAKQQAKQAALQFAMQVDQMKLQTQTGQPMNYQAIQEQIMREGGWVDTDAFFNDEDQAAGTGEAIPPAILQQLGVE
jgi:hypothetical protein